MYEDVKQFIQTPQTRVVPLRDPLVCHMHGPPELAGVVSGTQIATGSGWRLVEDIAVGDAVMTFDHGLRPVREIRRVQVCLGMRSCHRTRLPLFIPAEAIGNRVSMLLPADQAVLLESDLAEALHGDPFALVPVKALEGYMGIERLDPGEALELVQLEFDSPEVIYANGAMMVHCGGDDAPETGEDGYEILSGAAAHTIVETLLEETAPIAYGMAAE